MFKDGDHIIKPAYSNENVLIQISNMVLVSKKTRITVPIRYKAIAIIDDKPLFRIESCKEKLFVKAYGKEYINKELKIAFIISKTFAQSAWGFGNIQVNNERLKEAYRIGANGRYTIEIVDYAKLIQAFPGTQEIDMEQVRERIISTLKTVGTPILSDYFSNTNTSVFEMNSLISDFREKFLMALQEEKIFVNMGIKIATITVNNFHTNEEDLEIIRKRINSGGEET